MKPVLPIHFSWNMIPERILKMPERQEGDPESFYSRRNFGSTGTPVGRQGNLQDISMLHSEDLFRKSGPSGFGRRRQNLPESGLCCFGTNLFCRSTKPFGSGFGKRLRKLQNDVWIMLFARFVPPVIMRQDDRWGSVFLNIATTSQSHPLASLGYKKVLICDFDGASREWRRHL